MKRFKKSLVTLLVLVFVLSIMGTGFAAPKFSDVTNEDLSDAIARLVALNIINGYPDGTFKPNNNITRAEFAKVVVTALGLGNAAQYAQGMTKFKDVTAAHWASGYIKVASDLGVVNGYPDGTFKPENNVSYAEAITMIVRALGYEPKAKALGGYPGGYLAVAAEKEITDGVNVVGNLPAIRGDVAKMLDNALEVPLMVQKTYGQFPEYEEKEGTSLLKTKLGVKVVEGIVESFDAEKGILKLTSVTEDGTAKTGTVEYTVEAGLKFDGLKNAKIKAWKLGSKLVYATVESEVIYDFVKAIDTTKKTVELTFAGKKYETVGDTVYNNVPVNNYGKFVISDGKIIASERLLAKTTAYIVKEVNTTKDKEYIKVLVTNQTQNYEKIFKIAPSDYAFVKNNKFVSLADIDEGDVVYIDTTNKAVVAFNMTVEGKLTAVATDYVKIDGTKYDTNTAVVSSKDNGKNYSSGISDDLLGKVVVAYKGIDNKIAFIKGDAQGKTSTIYGFVLTYGSTMDDYRVKVLKDDGTVATYSIKSDKYSVVSAVYTNQDLDRFYKFTLDENGVITDVEYYTPDPYTVTGAGNGYMKTVVGTVESIKYVASNVKVFNVEDAFSGSDITAPDKVKVVDWKELVNAKSMNLNVKAYKATTDNEYRAIAITQGFGSVAGDEKIAFVKDAYKISSTKWEAVLITADGEATYTFETNMINFIDSAIKFRVKSVQEAVYEATVGTSDTITAIDTDKGFVTLASGGAKKVAADAIIVNLKGSDPAEVITLGDLKAELESRTPKQITAGAVYVDPSTQLVKVIIVNY